MPPESVEDMVRAVRSYQDLIDVHVAAEVADGEDEDEAARNAEELEAVLAGDPEDLLASARTWSVHIAAELKKAADAKGYYAQVERALRRQREISDAVVRRVLLEASKTDDPGTAKRIKSVRVNVGFRKLPRPVEIEPGFPPEMLPPEFVVRTEREVAYSPDKVKIGKALRADVDVPGAKLGARRYRIDWGQI